MNIRMNHSWFLAVLLLMASSPSLSQLTIKNPQHLEMPEEKAKILLSIACRVVAEEFHIRNASELEFPLTLVLGEKEEHYTIDQTGRVYTIYMEHWDETKFATVAMHLAVHRLSSQVRENRMLKEILRRMEQISPVSANRLRGTDGTIGPPPASRGNDCLSAILDASVPTVPRAPCGPAPDQTRGRPGRP